VARAKAKARTILVIVVSYGLVTRIAAGRIAVVYRVVPECNGEGVNDSSGLIRWALARGRMYSCGSNGKLDADFQFSCICLKISCRLIELSMFDFQSVRAHG
jgi:hypothetical protein